MDLWDDGPSRRTVLAGTGLSLITLALAGCTAGGRGEQDGPPSGRITFQTPSASGSWDPVLGQDLESQRIMRQVYDTLLGTDPRTGKLAPGLATSWHVSEDGLTYEFGLRKGVRFHDDTPVDAEAVVANFRRWRALGRQDSTATSGVWAIFDADRDPHWDSTSIGRDRPSADPDDRDQHPAPTPSLSLDDPVEDPSAEPGPVVKEVLAVDASTVRITLHRRLTPLLRALTQPVFGIVSPAALKRAGALGGRAETSFLDRSPVGSGPFNAAAYGDTVTLSATRHHFAGTPQVGSVDLIPTPQAGRRRDDLIRGRSDGFDLVTVDILKDLMQAGLQVIPRDPFSVTFLGLDHDQTWLKDERVRRAIAHAIDRDELTDLFLDSTEPADSLLPASLGIDPPKAQYPHDPTAAKDLLDAAGYDGSPIPFAFPTDVARPYLPLPELLYSRLSAQLGRVGLIVQPHPIPWDDGYLDTVRERGHAGLHLLGRQGTYRDPEAFLGDLFSRKSDQFHWDSPEVRRRLRVARSLPEGEERESAYADIVELIAVDLPVVPLVHPIAAVALGAGIRQYPFSPVLDEPLSRLEPR